MHKKLLLFVGLVVGVTFTSSLLQSNPSFAADGETYQWTSATTVQGSGGKYKGKTTFSVTADRKFSGSVTELISTNINVDVIYGACNNTTGRIVISDANRKTGTFWIGDLAAGTTTGCGSHPVSDVDMVGSFSIVAQAATPPGGESDAAWKAKNCNTLTNSNEKTRCTAIKACVVDKSKPAADCEAAWTSCMAPDQSTAAYTACAKQIAAGNTADAKDTPADEEDNKSSCKVDGVGWIICPVMRLMAQVTDGAYSVVAVLLKTPPVDTDTSKPTYQAWSIMRNFANIAFVIAFLVVIYSQITGVGMSSYGVKKMLPRIIIAAILVNVSYWICAVAVDVANIAGSSVSDLLDGISGQLYNDTGAIESGAGGKWDVITVGILGTVGAAAVLYAGLAVLLPVLVAALATIVTLVVVLTIRQALIIILIVVSPLAFVAYLLPNTETWFKKWRSAFQVLLVMYPIIGIMFGGCALASTIISQSAGKNFALQVMGAGVTVVPLFLAPFIIKTINGGLNRFGVNFNDPSKGIFDRSKKAAEGYRDKRQDIQGARRLYGTNMFREGQKKIRGDGTNRIRNVAAKTIGVAITPSSAVATGLAVRGLNKEMQVANAKKALSESKQDYVANRVSGGDEAYAKRIAGPTGDVDRIKSQAIAASKNETNQAIKDAEISANIPPGAVDEMGRRLAEAIDNNDSVQARAMQNMLLTSGSAGLSEYRKTMTDKEGDIDPNTGTGSALRENLLNNHAGVKAQANDLVQQAVQGAPMSSVSNSPDTWKLSDEDLVHQKPASLKLAISSNAVTKEQALRIIGNDQLNKHLDQETRTKIEDISRQP